MEQVINEDLEQTIFHTLNGNQHSIVRGVKRYLNTVDSDIHTFAKSIDPKNIIGSAHAQKDETRTNWAETISFTPKVTYRPKNRHQLVDCIKKAKKDNLKVRCIAEGHSWSSLSVTQSCLLVMDDLTDIDIEHRSNGEWILHAEAGKKETGQGGVEWSGVEWSCL